MAIQKRGGWQSRLGFILASAGSATGLGAIWRFPYVTAQEGGGGFLVLFVVFSLTLGLLLLIAETTVGRTSQRGAVSAFGSLGGAPWRGLGYLSLVAGFLVYAFYSVVGGWTLMYLYRAISGQLLSTDVVLLEQQFNGYISNGPLLITTQFLYIGLTLAVVIGGVRGGIEKISKILMPSLFIMLIILVLRSVTLDGAMEGVMQFLIPDWSKIDGGSILSALGLAIFSLSLGVGGMLAYGSYVDRDVNLVTAAKWITGLSIMVCLLAGLMILPAVAAYHLEPQESVGLTFMTMPIVFSKMPMGSLFAVMFFFLLFIAALTSSVNMLELLVVYLQEERHMARVPASLLASVLVFLAGVPCALSFGIWKGVQWLSSSRGIFDWVVFIASDLMMPLSCLGLSLFVGWFAWKKLHFDFRYNLLQTTWIKATYRWVIPAVIILIMMYQTFWKN